MMTRSCSLRWGSSTNRSISWFGRMPFFFACATQNRIQLPTRFAKTGSAIFVPATLSPTALNTQ